MARKAFRATSGLDAAGEKVINVATADRSVNSDGVNVEFFHKYNSINQYDETRDYDQYMAVIYQSRIYYAKENITTPAGAFDPEKWVDMRVDPKWEYINSTLAVGYNVVSGSYIAADNKYNDLSFNMPTNPVDGDTIYIRDIGGQPGVKDLVFSIPTAGTAFEVVGVNQSTKYRATIPFALYMFIYKENGRKWLIHVDGPADQSYFVGATPVDPFQLQSGMKIWRQTSQGKIDLQLPKYANHGDMISTWDIDGLNSVNHSTLRVHPDSGHFIDFQGVTEIESRTSGYGTFVFDATKKMWEVWDGDLRTRLKIVKADTALLPFNHVLVAGGPTQTNQTVTLTLPTEVAIGDTIQFTLDYMRKGQSCIIKVKDHSNDVIAGTKDQFQFQMRSEYPPIDGWPLAQEIEIDADTDYVPFIELVYSSIDPVIHGVTHAWVISMVVPKVERVDPNHRDRVGVAALATQDEVNKNWEDNPNDQTIVTPKTLANKTSTETRRGIASIAKTTDVNQNTTFGFKDDVIITPKKLNERTATETRRGVAEISTQPETNAGVDDTTIITPKKLNDRYATETLSGIIYVTQQGGKAATTRGQAGTFAYDINDHTKALTPKNFNELNATETSKGVGYVATAAEVIGGSSDNKGPLFVTPAALQQKTATESRIGLAEIATQDETNNGVDDQRYITPMKLQNRVATEARKGIAAIASQLELVAGENHEKMATPLTIKTHLNDVSRLRVVDADGLTINGSIWETATIGVVQPTEVQRGSARLSTQVEVNTGTDDTTIVTPKKLQAKKATQVAEGIVRFSTDVEMAAGASSNTAASPVTIKRLVQTEATWSSTESRRGFVKLSANNITWVGDNVSGSTQDVNTYNNDGFAVSPRSLNYALQNYLPKMATAQDSLKLGGVVSGSWLRRDVAQTVTGAMTFTTNVTMQSLSAQSTLLKTLSITDNTESALTIGSRGRSGNAGIVFNANSADANIWMANAHGDDTLPPYRFSFSAVSADGTTKTQVVSFDREGCVYANKHFVTDSGNVILKSANGKIYSNGDSANNAIFSNAADTYTFGNTSRQIILATNTDTGAMVGLNGVNHAIIHRGNYQTQLNDFFLARNGSNTITGSIRCVQNNAKHLRFITDNRYISTEGTNLLVGNTEGLIVLDTQQNPVVRIGNYTYQIYHQGNKPTAQDVGAVDVNGSSANNLSIRDWIKVGNVKIIANRLTKTVEFVWEE